MAKRICRPKEKPIKRRSIRIGDVFTYKFKKGCTKTSLTRKRFDTRNKDGDMKEGTGTKIKKDSICIGDMLYSTSNEKLIAVKFESCYYTIFCSALEIYQALNDGVLIYTRNKSNWKTDKNRKQVLQYTKENVLPLLNDVTVRTPNRRVVKKKPNRRVVKKKRRANEKE